MGAIIGLGFMGIGGLITLIGGIMLLVKAFQKHIGWGIASLLIPFVLLVFVIMNFGPCKKAFFIWIGGVVLIMIGAAIGGFSAPEPNPDASQWLPAAAPRVVLAA